MNAKREALINKLRESFRDEAQNLHELDSKFSKGNTLWTVWKTGDILYLAEFTLSNPDWGGEWAYEKRLETDPPLSITCPIKYLNKTPALNDDWRQLVRARISKIKETKKKIIEMFKEREGRKLRVVFTPDPGYYVDIPYLDVISFYPLEGRYEKNGKRYSVPVKLVTEMFYWE